MTRTTVALALGGAVVAAGVLVPLAASPHDLGDGDRYCAGPGMMHGPGARGWAQGTMPGQGARGGRGMMGDPGDAASPGDHGGLGLGAIGRPDLSGAQRADLAKLRDGLRQEHLALRERIAEQETRLESLSSASQPDAKAVGAASLELHRLRAQLPHERAQATEKARALLTPEQRAQLERRGGAAAGRSGPGGWCFDDVG